MRKGKKKICLPCMLWKDICLCLRRRRKKEFSIERGGLFKRVLEWAKRRRKKKIWGKWAVEEMEKGIKRKKKEKEMLEPEDTWKCMANQVPLLRMVTTWAKKVGRDGRTPLQAKKRKEKFEEGRKDRCKKEKKYLARNQKSWLFTMLVRAFQQLGGRIADVRMDISSVGVW